MDDAKIEEAAFLASMNGEEFKEPPAEKAEGEKESLIHEAEETKAVEESEKTGEEEGKEPEELPKIAGFTEEELKNLLANAAKVVELEQAVRKAHGKIGELNGKLQEMGKAPAKEPEPDPIVKQVEEDYPDIAKYVQQHLASQKQVEQPQETPQQAAPEVDLQLELKVMDHVHKGWREKVAGRDFNLWLGSQPEDVRNKFDTAQTADELASVIGQFDNWSKAKSERTSNGKQRLQQAMTPEGKNVVPQREPTEEEAFIAAFKGS